MNDFGLQVGKCERILAFFEREKEKKAVGDAREEWSENTVPTATICVTIDGVFVNFLGHGE